ncbi:PEP_CTERM-anchored TLD domain-containing protein [Zemynaea arenosa]|nr:PEP_CTERM-anchored TLD domain-containing protein [Massilia arenosa]
MKAIAQALGTAAVLLAGLVPAAHAGDIIGGSALLNPAQQAQLESWLGQGEFNLTNIYARDAGDTSLDFHAAADYKGKTFTLMQVTNGTDHWLVGGYNPQSWESNDTWHETPLDADRVGFIFNLTADKVYHQIPSTYILPSQGQKQTWNSAEHGPAFGEGGDLWVTGDMQSAYSWLFTYGDPAEQGTSLIDGSRPDPLPTMLQLEGMEVFTVAVVPEPSTWAMLGAGLLVTAGAARRRKRT